MLSDATTPIQRISTHDLTRRSTKTAATQTFINIFQLTTSQGGRRSGLDRIIMPTCISTHDLTRRSTVKKYKRFSTLQISTHDLTRRSTTFPITLLMCQLVFQLTTSQGGRRAFGMSFHILYLFQLTTSQGGRQERA